MRMRIHGEDGNGRCLALFLGNCFSLFLSFKYSFSFLLPCCATCRILVSWPGFEPVPKQWKCRFLTTVQFSSVAQSSLYHQEIWSFVFKIEVWLIYNVVLVAGIQQSDSIIYLYIIFFRLFSIIVYYKMLNTVPCAI